MRLSQDDFARELRAAGARIGKPNSASKRYVQRLEAGEITTPRPGYARALEMVTGVPIESLGFPAGTDSFVVDDGRGGHDLEVRTPPPSAGAIRSPQSNYSGVWLSRYEFFSSGREQMFVSQHYVVLLQHNDRLTVRSLAGSADSSMGMDLTVDGSIITGTWVEDTARTGYYKGARYHGAIQLLAEPSGRRLVGKWVGFGSDSDVNTGPWALTFQDGSTSKATLAAYDRRPND
ncbi:XRE family transcriptional regulator [Nucisporomicrobium flavum]|nr:XRE family transcriptional regulator [Nucisporomicrobium flavum]